MSGAPRDFLRPGQTPASCLGVKGSPVQIRPSRRVLEHLYLELGTKTAMIVPTGPAGMSKASKAAAAQSLLTQPLRRMPTTYRRPRPATRSPNVASTSSDAEVSRANTRLIACGPALYVMARACRRSG